MLSFWEKKDFVRYDHIVIGAGVTGVSTACALKEKNPKCSVLLLDRGILPTGASTKNAGFACIGSYSEKLSDLALLGEDKFLQLIQDRLDGLFLIRKRLGDDNIDYQNNGGFEIVLKGKEPDLSRIAELNKVLEPIFKKPVFHLMPHLISRFGLNADMAANIVVNPMEGQLDTGRMMHTLLNYAGILRVRTLTGADVMNIEEDGDSVRVEVRDGDESIYFRGSHAAICTNAFTKQFLPAEDIQPGRGQVLCTSRIPGLKAIGTFSFEEGFYYFRNFGDRIIFGGGRNLDFEGETTAEFALNDTIQQQLEFYLEELIVPGEQFTITDRWTGIMAFGGNKLPIVKKVSDRIVVGARLNGMGVALGSKIADRLSAMMLGG
jgi:glycine/D-amino acid oxidase-like deaminating enzyme